MATCHSCPSVQMDHSLRLAQVFVIHCAASDPSKPRAKDFIREILELLVTAKVEALIFKKAISLSRSRLRTYWKWTDGMIRKCSKHLQHNAPFSSRMREAEVHVGGHLGK